MSMYLPTTFSDPFFGRDGLVDQMFSTSFPWKMLKSFAPEESETFLPSLDVRSDEKAYTVHAEIPGVSKDGVKLEVHDGRLVLSGEKKEEVADGETKHVIERRFGSFERTMTLPDDADVEHITANHKDGVLTVTIPRVTPKENRKSIAINAD